MFLTLQNLSDTVRFRRCGAFGDLESRNCTVTTASHAIPSGNHGAPARRRAASMHGETGGISLFRGPIGHRHVRILKRSHVWQIGDETIARTYLPDTQCDRIANVRRFFTDKCKNRARFHQPGKRSLPCTVATFACPSAYWPPPRCPHGRCDPRRMPGASQHQVIDRNVACSCHSDEKPVYEGATVPSETVESGSRQQVKTSGAAVAVVARPVFTAEDGSGFVPVIDSTVALDGGEAVVELEDGLGRCAWTRATRLAPSSCASIPRAMRPLSWNRSAANPVRSE